MSLSDTAVTVSLPTDSAISLFVSVDFPPRNRTVSQQSTIVWASSPYAPLSCATDCRTGEIEMLRLRTTAMDFSTSGMRPMLANSSRMKLTGVGRLPPCSDRARSQSRSRACHMSTACRNE